jgi:hypothetical protein
MISEEDNEDEKSDSEDGEPIQNRELTDEES